MREKDVNLPCRIFAILVMLFRLPAYISYTAALRSGLAFPIPVHQTSGLPGF